MQSMFVFGVEKEFYIGFNYSHSFQSRFSVTVFSRSFLCLLRLRLRLQTSFYSILELNSNQRSSFSSKVFSYFSVLLSDSFSSFVVILLDVITSFSCFDKKDNYSSVTRKFNCRGRNSSSLLIRCCKTSVDITHWGEETITP